MPISFYLLIPILCYASWSDWKDRKIPNHLLLPSFFIAVPINFLSMGLKGILFSFTGALVGFALLILPYLAGGMGAGDVKFLMVIGAFGGANFVLWSFVFGAILGGIIAIFLLIYKKLTNFSMDFIPYGIPLTFGTLGSMILQLR